MIEGVAREEAVRMGAEARRAVVSAETFRVVGHLWTTSGKFAPRFPAHASGKRSADDDASRLAKL